MDAAALPWLWTPRLEFRLRRERSLADDRVLVGVDSAAAFESSILGTPPAGLPRGGDIALMGVKPYTLIPNPSAIVQPPYSLAQYHQARDAAPVGGVILIPAGASNINPGGVPVLNKANQTWQQETPGNVLPVGLDFRANGVTFEGGQVSGLIMLLQSAGLGVGHSVTIRNVKRIGGNTGISCEGKDNLRVLNCEGTNMTLVSNQYNGSQGTVPINGQTVENCIINNPANSQQGTINGNDQDHLRQFTKLRVWNNYIDNGPTWTGGGDKFGLEFWGHIVAADGTRPEVAYNTIKGGNGLSSMVRSKGIWVHHNVMDLTVAYSALEMSGSNANTVNGEECSGWLVEENIVTGTGGAGGARRGWFCYNNTGGRHHTIRQNKVTGVEWAIGGYPDSFAGDYALSNNCLVNTGTVVPGPWGIANPESNNGANGCSY